MAQDKARIVAVANQKGGVGKTTTSVNLAAGLAQMGRRVLLVDMDPQGNATTGSGVELESGQPTIYEVLTGDRALSEIVLYREPEGIHVAPANSDLTAAEVALMERIGRERVLSKSIEPVAARYQHIIIDCPPALNVLTLNALTAAHGVLIPMQCEYYALEGLTALMGTIEEIRDSVNEGLEIEGLIRTMYDVRNNLSGEVSRQLHDYFGDKVFRTIVPRNVRVAEAPSFGQSVLCYDADSRGSLAYQGLAGEYVRRLEEQPVT